MKSMLVRKNKFLVLLQCPCVGDRGQGRDSNIKSTWERGEEQYRAGDLGVKNLHRRMADTSVCAGIRAHIGVANMRHVGYGISAHLRICVCVHHVTPRQMPLHMLRAGLQRHITHLRARPLQELPLSASSPAEHAGVNKKQRNA